jgi:hypothetical protein
LQAASRLFRTDRVTRDVASAIEPIPDGLVAVVKRDCPTCALVVPVLRALADAGAVLCIYSQDDPAFPPALAVRDDRGLETSYRLGVSTVPTVLRVQGGREIARVEGWDRAEWEALTGTVGLGPDLPAYRPGCGSRSAEPHVAADLAVRVGGVLASRLIEPGELEDEAELCFARGWTDGLPVVPPTPARVLAMLEGTRRLPDEVVAVVPPDLVECTVEKVALNAVLAGCRPEYLPVVLTAVEAACSDAFNAHGILATTWFSGPVVIVNGPVAGHVGMNAAGNCLGQGNRANATIGRALQLVIRNVGGGRPGEVDRATLGTPGKFTCCFAEREHDSPWEPLATERAGLAPGTSALTLFAGGGVHGVADQQSRTPESLARTFAAVLRVVFHPKLVLIADAILVVSPEHARVFRDAGWSKARLREELEALLTLPGRELVRGAGGIAEGLPEAFAGADLPKFRPGGLLIVHAGGTAGMFSAVIGGWASGAIGSDPVTMELKP